jgi:mycothiol synthase
MDTPARTVVSNDPDEPSSAAAAALLRAAALVDGRQAVSEQGRLALRSARPGVRHIFQWAMGELVGYGQVDASGSAEIVVAPDRRGRGFGRQLAAEAVALGAQRFWSHGGHPGAAKLAGAQGLGLVRELLQLRLPLPLDAEQQAALAVKAVPPEGVEFRTFRPGTDDEAWLALNATAFASHPEQGAWTLTDLRERLAERWFDAEGFFLAWRGPELVGAHWTKKVLPEGEVYVVAVAPAEQGRGLGRALTALGLRHLAADLRLRYVALYVDSDNPGAVRLYRSLGFTTHETDQMFG